MSNKSRQTPCFKSKHRHNNFMLHGYLATSHLIKGLISKEMSLIRPVDFVMHVRTSRLNEIKLSKQRCIPSSTSSITWFSLDNVDSRFLLAARTDGRFCCYDTFRKEEKHANLKQVFNLSNRAGSHSYSISCIQWYPIDTGMFFTSGMDQKFKVWDANTLQVVDEHRLEQKIYNHNLSFIMSSSSRNLAALALGNGQVRIVDINSGSSTHTLKGHSQSYCVCVQWSPHDANILASAGSDGRIAIWDVRSSKSCITYLDYERARTSSKKPVPVSISSKALAHSGPIVSLNYVNENNHIISLGKDNTLRLWDSQSGVNTLVNYGRVPLSSAVAEMTLQMTFTDHCQPNYLFVPSGNNLLMYDLLEGELKNTFKGHFDSINCCLYNPVQNEVYTGSKDRNVLVWATDNQINAEERESSSTSSTGNMYSVLSGTGRRQDNRDDWSDED